MSIVPLLFMKSWVLKNEEFSTEEAGSMVWDDTFWIMLLSHDFYKKIYKR